MVSVERPGITAQLRDTGVAAILRADRPDHLEAVAHELAAAGITCLELTLTTPGALDALARLRRGLDAGVALGMGSVLDAAQATAALDAGADFLVSPGVKTFHGYGMGSYCFFDQGVAIESANAFTVPDTQGVQLHDVFTRFLNGSGSIDHVVNGTGAAVTAAIIKRGRLLGQAGQAGLDLGRGFVQAPFAFQPGGPAVEGVG